MTFAVTTLRTPDHSVIKTLLNQTVAEVRQAPKFALGLKLIAQRLYDSMVSLWTTNIYLLDCHREVKRENAALHHMLATILARGEIRFSKEELDATSWDSRIRGYCVPGSSDVAIRISDEGLLVSKAPPWLAEAVDGRPVLDLALDGVERFLPIFDITELAVTRLLNGAPARESAEAVS